MSMNPQDIYQQLLEAGVPESDARTLTAIAGAESGYNPQDIGDYGTSVGLFQIHMPAWSDYLEQVTNSTNPSDWLNWLQNPENNLAAAIHVYKNQGLGAWTTYKTGAYRQFLSQVSDDFGNPVFPPDHPGMWNPKTGKWENDLGQSYGGGLGYVPNETPLNSGPTLKNFLGININWKIVEGVFLVLVGLITIIGSQKTILERVVTNK